MTRLKSKAKKLDVQAIILPTWPQDAPTIAKQARDIGIALPLIGTDGVELVLHTELGYQAFPWDVESTRVSLMQAFGTSNGTVTMGDVFLLAASTGARAAYLEVREAGGGTEAASSPWVELRWDPEVLDLVR